MMAESTSVLDVNEVVKTFGGVVALDGISFSLPNKKINILIGPNGSGKTTMVNVISGFYRPDSGDVFYQSKRITGLPPHKIYRMGISRTFQIPALFWKLTVLENLLVAQKDNPGETFLRAPFRRSWQAAEEMAIAKAKKILELVGLDQHWDKTSANLSGGQMKLLEMGRALMSDSKLLLLDEPISGVNPTLARTIFDTIVRLRNELEISFLIIEHRLDIALGYADNVIAMARGDLIAQGAPDSVVSDQRVIEAYLGA